MKMAIEEKIANASRVVNAQIETFADATKRQILNVYVSDTGEIYEIEDSRLLQARVDDAKKRLDDALRNLEVLMSERKEKQ